MMWTVCCRGVYQMADVSHNQTEPAQEHTNGPAISDVAVDQLIEWKHLASASCSTFWLMMETTQEQKHVLGKCSNALQVAGWAKGSIAEDLGQTCLVLPARHSSAGYVGWSTQLIFLEMQREWVHGNMALC